MYWIVGWPPGGSAGTSFCSGTEMSISRLAMGVSLEISVVFCQRLKPRALSHDRALSDPENFDEKFDCIAVLKMPAEFKSAASEWAASTGCGRWSEWWRGMEYPKAGSDGHKFRRRVTRALRLFQL